MNIFKIISMGDGSVQEPNVTAFLGYLLDPTNEHGLQDSFLKLFLSPLITDKSMENLQYDRNIRDLSRESKFSITLDFEKKVRTKSKKERDIDIVIWIKDNNVLTNVICIENKIKNSSVSQGQLQDELDGIRNEITSSQNDTPEIGFVYLTPDKFKKSVEEFSNFVEHNPGITAKHYSWQKEGEEVDNIITMLSGILNDEACGNIEPINEYSRHTIKSFLTFIKADFQSYKEEKETKRTQLKKSFREYIADVCKFYTYDEKIKISDLKEKILEKINQDNPSKIINRSTLNAQVYSVIINEKNRKHYQVKERRKDDFDLFYYADEDEKVYIRKYDKDNPPKIEYYYADK